MYSCHVCLQSFSTERKVELHIMQSHRKPSLEKKTVTLDEVCGKTQEDFCTKRAFQEHGKQHQETSFICEMCPAVWNFNYRGNDQVVEAAHQLLNKRMQSSKYWSRKPGTKKEGQGLFRAVIHCNAYNV